jgi:acetyl-CoA acetyltransferase
MAEAAYIYGVTRTASGRYGGALAKSRPDDLAVAVGQGLALVLESC